MINDIGGGGMYSHITLKIENNGNAKSAAQTKTDMLEKQKNALADFLAKDSVEVSDEARTLAKSTRSATETVTAADSMAESEALGKSFVAASITENDKNLPLGENTASEAAEFEKWLLGKIDDNPDLLTLDIESIQARSEELRRALANIVKDAGFTGTSTFDVLLDNESVSITPRLYSSGLGSPSPAGPITNSISEKDRKILDSAGGYGAILYTADGYVLHNTKTNEVFALDSFNEHEAARQHQLAEFGPEREAAEAAARDAVYASANTINESGLLEEYAFFKSISDYAAKDKTFAEMYDNDPMAALQQYMSSLSKTKVQFVI